MRALRALALDFLRRRDGLAGWTQARGEFLRSVRKPPQVLQADVQERLRRIIEHAFTTSPYYRELTGGRVPPLADIPFMTKDILKASKSAMISDRFREADLVKDVTGGTTGTQTSFYRDRACTVSRVGRQAGVLEFSGYRAGMPRGLIWGVNADLAAPPTHWTFRRWLRDFANHQAVLPCAVMTEEGMRAYHARLLRFRPAVLYGYPNAMVQFGRFVRDARLTPVAVPLIMTTAERLTPGQRRFLTEQFGGEVFNLYCTREYGCIGFECREHDGFHIDAESVHVEIVDGELVITDLLNYGMPFVRNRSGDRGTLAERPCRCGLALPRLQGLDGRVTDVIRRVDGSVVLGLILSDVFQDMPAIRASQFVQERLGAVTVRVVAPDGLSEADAAEALRQVREIVGAQMQVDLQRVPEIARNPRSGKYQEVISTVGGGRERDIADD